MGNSSDEGAERSAGPGSGQDQGEPANAIWHYLLDLDSQLFEQKNIRFLTPEARVLIHLKLSGSMPVTTAMNIAGISYRGFYAVLDRLREAGVVATVKDADDQRVRHLSLDPAMAIATTPR